MKKVYTRAVRFSFVNEADMNEGGREEGGGESESETEFVTHCLRDFMV